MISNAEKTQATSAGPARRTREAANGRQLAVLGACLSAPAVPLEVLSGHTASLALQGRGLFSWGREIWLKGILTVERKHYYDLI